MEDQPTTAPEPTNSDVTDHGLAYEPAPAPKHGGRFVAALIGLVILNIGVITISSAVLIRSWKAVHIPKVVIATPVKSAISPAVPAISMSTTRTYTSKLLSLTLNYPADWEIRDTDTSLTIDSPFVAYDKYAQGDNSQKTIQKVRGVLRIEISHGVNPVYGGTVVKNSDFIEHPGMLDGHKSSYLSYFGQESQSFNSIAFTGGSSYKLGERVTFEPNSKIALTPITLSAGYWDVDAPRQAFYFDDIPIANFDKTDTFNQALDIIKSIRSN